MYEPVHSEAVRCTNRCMQWQSDVRTGACSGSPVYGVVHVVAVRCTEWCMQWQSSVRSGACSGSPVYEPVSAVAVRCTNSDSTLSLPVNTYTSPFPAPQYNVSCSRCSLSLFLQHSVSATISIRDVLSAQQDEPPISMQRAHFVVTKWQMYTDVSVT